MPCALWIGRANVALSAGIIILLAVPTRTNAQVPVLTNCEVKVEGGFLNDDLGLHPDPFFATSQSPITVTLPNMDYTVSYDFPDGYQNAGSASTPGVEIAGASGRVLVNWILSSITTSTSVVTPTSPYDHAIRTDISGLSAEWSRPATASWSADSPATVVLGALGFCVALDPTGTGPPLFEGWDLGGQGDKIDVTAANLEASIAFYGPAPYCGITTADDELDLGEHAIGSGMQGVAATMANAPQTATAHVTANLGQTHTLNVMLVPPSRLDGPNSQTISFTHEWAASTDRTGPYSTIPALSDQHSGTQAAQHQVYYIFGGMADTGVQGAHMPGMYSNTMMVSVTCM